MSIAISNNNAARTAINAKQQDNKGFTATLQQTANKHAKPQSESDSTTTSSSTTGTSGSGANNNSTASGGIVGNTAQAGQTIIDPKSQIDRLNSNGDQVVMTMTAEGKLQVPIPETPIALGGKGQYGFGITVKQVGDTPKPGTNGKQPQYEVTFDKNLLAGGMIEPDVPGIDPAAELNVRTSGSVTMRFDSKEDAARAVGTLQRLAASEAVRDAGNSVIPFGGGALSSPFSNPVTNGNGFHLPTPGNIIADRIKPPAQEMNFLRDHVVSYTSRVGLQERGKVAVKAANLGIETRLDNNQTISRTVVLPQNGQPGRLTYTISGDLQLSTKEKLTLGKQNFDQLEVGYVPQNIVDHGQFRAEISLSWTLPAGTATSNGASSGGVNTGNGNTSGIPELSGLGAPDEISAKLQLDYQDQKLTDLSRTDIQRWSVEMIMQNPGQHGGPAVNNLLHGDLRGAFAGMGNDLTVTAQHDTIRRDGIHQQHEAGVEMADTFEAKVSLEANIGLDDVTARQTRTFTGTDIAKRLGGPQPVQGSQPIGDAPQTPAKPDQVVVVPHDGLNVRQTPSTSGHKISAFQSGTFLQPTGQQATDKQGNKWIEVTGLDANDKHVKGWVEGPYVQPHKAGAMNDTGRINPDLDKQGYKAHTVKQGDTIWDVAQHEGVDFQEMVKLNSDHLIDPNLIFPGDTLYIPGTGRPVAQQPQSAQQQPNQPSASAPSGNQPSGPGTSSGGNQPSGPGTSSGGNQPSGPGTSSGGNQPSGPGTSSGGNQPSGPGTSSGGNQPSGPGASSGGNQPSGPGTSSSGNPPVTNQPGNGATTGRPGLDQILRDYQMPEDPGGMVDWKPGGPVGWFSGSVKVTATEGKLLDKLSVFELRDFRDIKDKAEITANDRYPVPNDKRGNFANVKDFAVWAHNDGHNDAFRHAYWNALMTKRFGANFTQNFTNAHEGMAGNPATREAMDLYNNSVGRRIAQEHPNASDKELADLVQQAIQHGDMVVIDKSGNLAWSNKVAYGEHGLTGNTTLPGVMPRPDANAGTES